MCADMTSRLLPDMTPPDHVVPDLSKSCQLKTHSMHSNFRRKTIKIPSFESTSFVTKFVGHQSYKMEGLPKWIEFDILGKPHFLFLTFELAAILFLSRQFDTLPVAEINYSRVY